MPVPKCGATPFFSGRIPPANRRIRSAPISNSPLPTSSRAATILRLPNFRRRPSGTPTADLLLDWGLAYDGLNQPDKALEKLRQAAAIEPTAHIYTQIGYIYAKRSQWTEAMQAFNTAEKLDPRLAITYMYKGQVYLATNQAAAAVTEFEHALALDFRLGVAQEGLATARQRLSGR